MKKQLLMLLLLPAMILASCSKSSSDNQPDTTDVKLKGTWTEVESKYAYYNAANVKIYEETTSLGQLSFDGKSTLTVTYEGDVLTGSYAVSKDSLGEYLTISKDGDSHKYYIIAISNTNLTLSTTFQDDTYVQDGKLKTAAKSILTSTLVKK
jgi:hypothetical protein